MKDIVEIVKSLEDSGLLPEGARKTFQTEAKEQRGGSFSMSLGTLGVSLLENILTGKDKNTGREGDITAGYRNRKRSKCNKIRTFDADSSFNYQIYQK